MVKKSEKPEAETKAPAWGQHAGFTTDTATGQDASAKPETEVIEPNTDDDDGDQYEHPATVQTAPTPAPAPATKKRARKAKAVEPENNPPDDISINTTELVHLVERIERLKEEESAIKEDIRELYIEVKDKHYSAAILRKVIARRAADPEKLKETQSMIDLYEEALR